MSTDGATKFHITKLTEPDELFCHYPGQHEIQSCHLALDLEDGELTADYNGNIGSGRPKSVHESRTLWFTIPCLTDKAANALMEDAKPLAQRILAGAVIELDGNANEVGALNDDAQAAYEDLDRMCDAVNFSEADCVAEYDAGDWFSGEGSRADVAERLGITATTTDDQIAAIARAEEEDAHTSTSMYGYLLLTKAEEYLTELRDELRADDTDGIEPDFDEEVTLTLTLVPALARTLSTREMATTFVRDQTDRFETVSPGVDLLDERWANGSMKWCESASNALMLMAYEKACGFEAALLWDLVVADTSVHDEGDPYVVLSTRPME